MRTLSQILIDSNSYLDLEASLPEGDDLTVRTTYAQQAVREWADAYRWKELSTPYTVIATLTTASLPANFREFEAIPKDTGGQFYPEILSSERVYKERNQRYCYVEGNESLGFTLTINGVSALATLSITYQRLPTNLVSLSDICEVPDDQYVVQKINAMVLQSRSDERFPIVEADAQRRLANMIGRSMVTRAGGENRVRRTGSSAWAIGRSRG